jgi:hypothetical protein
MDGMDAQTSRGLAKRVKSETGCPADVVADAAYFVVQVHSQHGLFTLYDEADWTWLKPRVLEGDDGSAGPAI